MPRFYISSGQELPVVGKPKRRFNKQGTHHNPQKFALGKRAPQDRLSQHSSSKFEVDDRTKLRQTNPNIRRGMEEEGTRWW